MLYAATSTLCGSFLAVSPVQSEHSPGCAPQGQWMAVYFLKSCLMGRNSRLEACIFLACEESIQGSTSQCFQQCFTLNFPPSFHVFISMIRGKYLGVHMKERHFLSPNSWMILNVFLSKNQILISNSKTS